MVMEHLSIKLMSIQLIADSGSTKTDWRLLEADGKTHASQTDGLNPYYQSATQMVDILKEQLHLPVNDARIEQLFFYGAGCSGPSVNSVVRDALKTVFPDAQHIDVNSDMLGAARGASGHQAGLSVFWERGLMPVVTKMGRLRGEFNPLGSGLATKEVVDTWGKPSSETFFRNACQKTCIRLSRPATRLTGLRCSKTPTKSHSQIDILLHLLPSCPSI
jgi:glucosamine kinase